MDEVHTSLIDKLMAFTEPMEVGSFLRPLTINPLTLRKVLYLMECNSILFGGKDQLETIRIITGKSWLTPKQTKILIRYIETLKESLDELTEFESTKDTGKGDGLVLSIVEFCAREYGWTTNEILDTPFVWLMLLMWSQDEKRTTLKEREAIKRLKEAGRL